MLNLSASYRGWRRFARQFCDSASGNGVDNPILGALVWSVQTPQMAFPDKKTLDCVVITIPLLPHPHPICGNVYPNDAPNLGRKLNA
jgi:hypothetical protein